MMTEIGKQRHYENLVIRFWRVRVRNRPILERVPLAEVVPQTTINYEPFPTKEPDGDITEDPRFGSQRPLGKEGCWKDMEGHGRTQWRVPGSPA